MALPSSGQIEFDDFNTDRGISSGTEVDMATAGTAYSVSYTTDGTNDLQMSEFYGKSAGGSTPTYSVSPSVTSVNEGSSVVFTVTTTNVPNGTALYYTTVAANSTNVDFNDFTDYSTSGTFNINSNTGAFTRTLRNDVTTEGTEYFYIQIRTGSTGGTVVATSSTITINDTSLTSSNLWGCDTRIGDCRQIPSGTYSTYAACMAAGCSAA